MAILPRYLPRGILRHMGFAPAITYQNNLSIEPIFASAVSISIAMKSLTLSNSFVCALLVAFLSVSFGKATAGAQEDILELTIHSVEATHYTIDIIPIVIELKNIGTKPISLMTPFHRHQGLKVGFSRPGSDPDARYKRAMLSFVIVCCVHDGPQAVIQPKGSIRHLCFVSPSFVGLEFILPMPGTLRLKARYTGGTLQGRKLRIESKTASVSLISSKNLPEWIRKLFGNAAWHRFVIQDGLVEEKASQPFKDFLSTGERCPQSDLLSFTVGRSYQRGFGKLIETSRFDPQAGRVVHGKTRVPVRDVAAAIAAYTNALQTKSSDLKAQTLLHLAECHWENENNGEVTKALGQIPGLECDVAVMERHKQLSKKLQYWMNRKKKD